MTQTHYALEYQILDDGVEFDSDSIDEVDSYEANQVVIRKSFPESWIFDTYFNIGYELKTIYIVLDHFILMYNFNIINR